MREMMGSGMMWGMGAWGLLVVLVQLVAVAERQQVTQAAQAVKLAKSVVSHAIAALEARHTTKLFDRV
jgi:DNA-binding transcriptional LysR family regulator